MRALIVADTHSNLEALQAVLEDAQTRGGFDQVWCLGDLVGYGPDPVACIELLRSHHLVCIAGNHDRAAVGELSLEEFNSYAAHAARWTGAQLGPEEVKFLSGLPHVERYGDFTLVHGSLRDPVWEYLTSQDAALDTFGRMESPYCLVGHSHIPFLCTEDGVVAAFGALPEDQPLALDLQRLIINPGSVGQPRDGDPRPSYALYDDGDATISRHRVLYDISVTQEKMRQAQLPDYLIQRLDQGR
jgi:diadenosine tetraphosphatase ApaH/serine/threonine PP2A family protein phosphatase